MSKARLGRDIGAAIVEAMGLPTAYCSGVEILLPLDGFATVSLTYPLTAEVLRKAAEIAERPKEGGDGRKTVAVEFREDADTGYLVSPDGYRLAYGGVPSCWVVKPEDYPAGLSERAER